jgi:large subunit ribosomal protein L21
MFAVIKTGGKQYKVAKDDIVVVEKLDGEAGASIALESVLMLGDETSVTTGAPFIEGASVAAEVVEQTRGDKIIVFKKQRRQNYRRKNGHRQDLTVLKVTEILTDGKKAAKAAPKKKAAPKAEKADADAPKAAAKAKPAPKAKEEE